MTGIEGLPRTEDAACIPSKGIEEANGLESPEAGSAAPDQERPLSALSQFRQALARGARLLSGGEPEKAKLFKRGLNILDRSSALRLAKPISLFFTLVFLLGAFTPVLMATGPVYALTPPSEDTEPPLAPAGSEDFQLGAASGNLTVTTSSSSISVWTEEYVIKVDYSTSYVDYRICPYFSTDFIRYRRVNPQYAGDGTYDENRNELTISMTISSWGRVGNTVWFMESCPEFSLNQTFRIYRDYFELDVTYKPGTKKVETTYFIGLYSSSNSLYSLVNTGDGRYNRYMPGFREDLPDSHGMGGWYPSFLMYAPACDLRAPNRNMGVEWGYNETIAYLYSPIWMKDCGTGGASVMCLKYSSKNSVVPNIALGGQETFHMFCRPYKYTDGKQRGYDIGYAQWVAPKIASAWGNHNTPIFPLAVMDLGTWSTSFRSYVENSQVKVATYSTNPNQINWNYKSSQISNTVPGDAASVPVSWQLYLTLGTPMTTAEGRVVCNPVSGPYTQSGTYRWQLINNDPYMSWWTGTRGVFWDEMNMWTADNRLRVDYQNRADYLHDGFLRLVQDTYASGYWDYVISNPFSGLLHLGIASDLTLIEGYEPASVYNNDLTKHVQSTMNFVNNIPSQYRPRIVVYQNYAAANANDQEDVYSALLGAAKYKFAVTLLSFDSYDSQLHNLRMAEDMFKAMGCTRNSDIRTVTVDTLDLALSTSLATSAQMVVVKGGAKATITETADLSSFIFTNLHATSNDFDLKVPGGGYFTAGLGAQSLAPMTYTVDGYAKFSGRVDGEKTATISRNDNVRVVQNTAGSASVTLTSAGPNADLTVTATGGSTSITLKGFVPGKSYDVLVNSIVVDHKTAAADGTIAFTRTYGSNDRVQTIEASQPDTFAPHVVTCLPANGAASISISSQVRVSFNESMDRALTQAAFSLTGGAQVAGTFSWEDLDRTLVFSPSASLGYDTSYSILVSTSAKDLAGNSLTSPHSSTFRTELQPVVILVPSAPLSLVATGGTKSVSLSWQEPSSNGGAAISGYKVYRATSPGGQGPTPIATLGNVTSYQSIGLADGTTYYYKVSAINSAGEGARSSEASATTFSAPSQPSSITAVGALRSITISWSAPASDGGSAVSSYKLYRGSSPTSLSLLATLGTVYSYVDSSLTDGTTYYYKVSAINVIGEGTATAVVSTTTDTVVPGPPQGLIATASSESVLLSWSAPASNGGSAIVGYKIYRGESSGQLALLTFVGNYLSYLDPGLTNGRTYYYQVSAVNSVGEGARSSEAQATTSVQVPSAPTGLTASPLDGKVRLDWLSPSYDGGSTIVQFKIYRAIGSGSMSLLATLSPTTTYLDEGLGNGVTYRYVVSALNSMGESARSSEASAMPVGLPGAPTQLQAIPGNAKVTLSWTAPLNDGGSAIIGYQLYRGSSPTTLSALISLGTGTGYVDEGLSNGQQFFYSVAAVSSVGQGSMSAQAACIPGFVTSAPSSLAAQAYDSRVELIWGSPVFDNGYGVSAYTLYRGASPGDLVPYASLGTVLSYSDEEVVNGQTYYYRVTARNAMGESAFSSEASARPAALPSPPILLVATGGVGKISLTWQAPLDDGGAAVMGYAMFRGTSSSILSQVATVSSNSYEDVGLQASTLYYYDVRAFNALGAGPAISSSAMTFSLPSSPYGLATIPSSSSMLVSWSAPVQDGGSPILSYKVYRGASEDDLNFVASVPGSVSYTDLGLSPGTSYYYAVSAVNAVGEGAISTAQRTSTVATAPTAPLNLVSDLETAQIALDWDAPASDGGSAIIGYRIYRGTSSAHLTFLAETEATEYTDAEVTTGLMYYYQVSAANAVGEGNAGPEVSTMVVVLPSAPSNLLAIKGKNIATLTWDAPGQDGGATITSYAIYRGTSPSGLSKLTTVSSSQQFIDSSLPKGEKVYYRVSALSVAGESEMSNEASIALSKKPAPPKNPVTTSQDGKLSLSWEAPDDDGGEAIIGYAVYRHEPNGTVTPVAVVNSTSLMDMGLTNGFTYSYTIAAISSEGEGDPIESAPTRPYGLPASPPSLVAVPYDGMVLLQWDSPSSDGGAEIIAYDIYLVSNDLETMVGQVTGLMNSYVCHGLVNGNEYYFKVAAVNAAGESARCAVIGSPSAPVDVSGSIGSDALTLSGGILPTLLISGAFASLFLIIGLWRSKRGSNGQHVRSKATVERMDAKAKPDGISMRAPLAQSHVAKVAARPIAVKGPIIKPISSEEAAFERTLKDLEVTGKLW